MAPPETRVVLRYLQMFSAALQEERSAV